MEVKLTLLNYLSVINLPTNKNRKIMPVWINLPVLTQHEAISTKLLETPARQPITFPIVLEHTTHCTTCPPPQDKVRS